MSNNIWRITKLLNSNTYTRNISIIDAANSINIINNNFRYKNVPEHKQFIMSNYYWKLCRELLRSIYYAILCWFGDQTLVKYIPCGFPI